MPGLDVPAAPANQDVFPFGSVVFEFGKRLGNLLAKAAAVLSPIEGVKAVRSAPKSKKKKKTALRSDLRDLPISSLPGSVGRASRPVFE